MKQTLQLRLGQHLTMTPQLQQAIRLLQLSTLDLQAEIQEALESNPMLEMVEEGQGGADDKSGDERQDNAMDAATQAATETTTDSSEAFDLGADQAMSEIPDELPVDSSWEDTFESILPPSALSGSAGGEAPNFENQSGQTESLYDHLLWQLRLTPFSDSDFVIAMVIIDSIDEHGYLQASLDDIREAVMADEASGEEPPADEEIEAVLHRIQNFDPLGVGARTLQECMLVQLSHLDVQTPWLAQAKVMVKEHMDLLGGRNLVQLMRNMQLSEEDLRQVIALVQSLNPRPGSLVASRETEYIVPDIVVDKVNGRWQVRLNSEVLPRVRVNAGYASLVKRADNSSDNTFLKNQLQEARWFLKSLQSRHETLLKVATCIVNRQIGFFEYGEEAMKALVLHDVAEEVGMHESTISRVTTQKYMHTPRGVFELKYFFSSHVGTESGGECSATAIRALIKKLVAEEDSRKPLSDSKLAKVLGDQGIKVARRTIAKYRESISIPSSSDRKRLI